MDTEEMLARIDRIEAQLAIGQLPPRYALAVDSRRQGMCWVRIRCVEDGFEVRRVSPPPRRERMRPRTPRGLLWLGEAHSGIGDRPGTWSEYLPLV